MRICVDKASNRQSGFTLVEVLVSLFIFSILSTATLVVLTLTLQSKAQLKAQSEKIQTRSIARILLKADLENTLNIVRTDEYGQIMPIQFSGGNIGDDRVLILSRTGWDNPGGIERRSNLQSIEYRFSQGVLSRHIRPRFNAVSSVKPLKQVLLKGVRSARFTFFDGNEWGENWVTGQPPQGVPELPKLAALELVFENDETLKQIFYVGADQ